MNLLNEILEKYIKFKASRKINNWKLAGKPIPIPHELKQFVIKKYQSIYGCNILVETGTFRGDIVAAQRKNFKHIYSIELSEKLYAKALDRFRSFDNITILQGDSGIVLNEIVCLLTQPAIFWLDGHYSAGETAKGDKDCPIFEELDCILIKNLHKHVLLIDDARCFNGQGDYPTIENLTAYIKSKNNQYELEVKNDIIRYTIPT